MGMRLSAVVLVCAAGTAVASPVSYEIDPAHTYPSFEGDHMGGLSIWRGKFTRNSGTIVLDKDNDTGTVDVTVATSSVDFGHQEMNKYARGPEMLDIKKFPAATYKGTLGAFHDGAPSEVQGQLTMLGVTKPLTLHINQFLCKFNPVVKKEACGADASGTFNRADYGLKVGDKYGFKMEVKLAIQIEAIRRD
jgi:polyisoprenoid-binding protein YceI